MPFTQITDSDSVIIPGRPVCVAAVYNTLGDFKPLYICIEDLYGNICKTKVEYIKYKKDVRGGISFCCAYKSCDALKEIMLSYYIESHIWAMTS